MKKMTAKEFKQVLHDSGIVYSTKDMWEILLNKLSILEHYEADEMMRLNLMKGAEACRRRSNYIYDYLDARGFYDDIKNKAEEETT